MKRGSRDLGDTSPSDPFLSPALSLRYHNLHPDYIHQRLQSLGKNFALRVLLVQVDVVSRGPSPTPALATLGCHCLGVSVSPL